MKIEKSVDEQMSEIEMEIQKLKKGMRAESGPDPYRRMEVERTIDKSNKIFALQKQLELMRRNKNSDYYSNERAKLKSKAEAEKKELQDKLDDRTAQREHELVKQRKSQEHSDIASEKKSKTAKIDAMDLAAFKASLSTPTASALKAQEEGDIARINAEVTGDLRKNQKQFEADMYKMKAELTSSKELKNLDHINLKDLKIHEASLEAELHVFKSDVDTKASNQITTHRTDERLREVEGLMGFKQQDREHELSIDLKRELFRHILGKDRDTHQSSLKKPSSIDDEEVMKSLSRLLDDPEKYGL